MAILRVPRRAGWVLLVAAAAAAPGCINVGLGGDRAPQPSERVHTLDRAEITRPPVTKGPAPEAVIAVRSFRARDRFDRHVVARVDAGTVRSLDFDLWADEPAQAVTDAVREALVESGLCAAAPDAADGVLVHAVLDGVVHEFAWDEAGGAARFRARLTLSGGTSGRVLWTGVVEGKADLSAAASPGAAAKTAAPTPAGLGPAMARALGKALDAAFDAWRSSPEVQLALASRRQ